MGGCGKFREESEAGGGQWGQGDRARAGRPWWAPRDRHVRGLSSRSHAAAFRRFRLTALHRTVFQVGNRGRCFLFERARETKWVSVSKRLIILK